MNVKIWNVKKFFLVCKKKFFFLESKKNFFLESAFYSFGFLEYAAVEKSTSSFKRKKYVFISSKKFLRKKEGEYEPPAWRRRGLKKGRLPIGRKFKRMKRGGRFPLGENLKELKSGMLTIGWTIWGRVIYLWDI